MNKRELFLDILINIFLGTIVASIISYFFNLDPFSSVCLGVATAFMSFCGFILYNLVCNQNKFLETIQNDLIETHGIVTPYERKLAITAQVMPFHDATDYNTHINANTESIDLVRSFTYQDLILSPKYLNYFFNRIRRQSNGSNISRIIVIKKACQASLTYVVLSYLAGYKTYVIGDKYFRDFREKHNISKTQREILKGNPYIEKNETNYIGKYSIYQSHDDAPTVKPIDGTDKDNIYALLSCLKNNYCTEINTTSFEQLTSTVDLETILVTAKSSDNCCNKVKKTHKT